MAQLIRTMALGAIGFVVLALVLGAVFWPNKTAKQTCGSDIGALVASESIVTKRLKAPATASFPLITSDGVTVLKIGECKFRVKSYLDAQNSYGAYIRSIYTMNLIYNASSKTWTASNISIGP